MKPKASVPAVLPPTECIQEGYCRPTHRSKKDRAKWCRGKVGVPHRYVWVAEDDLPNRFGRPVWVRRVISERPRCLECGRVDWAWRQRCQVCRVPSNRTDFGSDGTWSSFHGGHCPVCYIEWYPISVYGGYVPFLLKEVA